MARASRRRRSTHTRFGPRATPFISHRARVLPAFLVATLLAVLLIAAPVHAQAALDWPNAEAAPVIEDLEMPTNVQVAQDGSLWYGLLAGTVARFDPATGETQTMYIAPDVLTGGERGLTGMALAHDFAETGAFYLYYTQDDGDPDGGTNRLVRVSDGTEHLLAEVPGAKEHNGGRIVVAPDGTLFVGTGENQLRDPAQDPASLLGKVLHLTPDGDPVDGNIQGLVHSLGHRNVFGLALDPENGALWATENSGWRRDEVNRIEAGANYGYPECEGHGLNGVDDPCPTDKGYTFPVLTFYEDRAAAPTGATFWQGDFYWASLNEASIHQIRERPDAQGWTDTVVFEHDAPLLDLHVAPDGTLYFATVDGIWRIEMPGDDPSATQDVGDGADPKTEASQGSPGPSWVAMVLALGALVLFTRRGRSR